MTVQFFSKPRNYFIFKFFFLPVFLSISFSLPDVFKDLNYDFLLDDNTKTQSKKLVKGKKKDAKKPFKEIVKDYQKIEGLFTIYWNDEKNKHLHGVSRIQIFDF